MNKLALVIISMLSTAVISSPLNATTSAPACLYPLFKPPVFETDCTFYETTSTMTTYEDCGGCALVTRHLGLGLPCRNSTTVPGIKYTTIVACQTESQSVPGDEVQSLPTPTPFKVQNLPTPTQHKVHSLARHKVQSFRGHEVHSFPGHKVQSFPEHKVQSLPMPTPTPTPTPDSETLANDFEERMSYEDDKDHDRKKGNDRKYGYSFD